MRKADENDLAQVDLKIMLLEQTIDDDIERRMHCEHAFGLAVSRTPATLISQLSDVTKSAPVAHRFSR